MSAGGAIPVVDLAALEARLRARAPALRKALRLESRPGGLAEPLDLIAQTKFAGDKRRAVKWARAWLELDGAPARRAGTARDDFAEPSSEPGFLERAGSRVRPLGKDGDFIFVEAASGERRSIHWSSLGRRRTFLELFAGDRIAIGELFPPTPRDRGAAFSLWAAQACLITACGRAGIADPRRLGVTMPKRRRA